MSDTALDQAARLRQQLEAERTPEDPPAPLEVLRQHLRAVPPGQWRALFAARDPADDLAGFAIAGRNLKDTENAHIRWFDVSVRPEQRRRGVGRALVAQIVDACADQGDGIVLITQTNERLPSGEAFVRSLGAAPGLPMRISQLDLRAVDRAQVAEWAALDPAGYRIQRIDDTVPGPLVVPYIQAAGGINDMPRGELALNDWKLTEPQIRQRESFVEQAGMRWWLLVAVHQASGEGVGFTEVMFDPRNPHAIEQEGTAVVREHRGHRIGLWMKAVMLRRILDELPGSRYIRTGNANVNEQMLAINTQLGFRHAWQSTLWQLPLVDAKKALEASAVRA
jgi:GNAT superfamily N-acetyltransferase